MKRIESIIKMNHKIVENELFKASLKELDQLSNIVDKLKECKLNLHFRELFRNEEYNLENCTFEGGTVLSRLLNVNVNISDNEYPVGLMPNAVEIEDFKSRVKWTIYESEKGDLDMLCERGFKKVDEPIPNDIKNIGVYLWKEYKKYVESQRYLEDCRSEDSEDEEWNELCDGINGILNNFKNKDL